MGAGKGVVARVHAPVESVPVIATGGEVLAEFVRQGQGDFSEPGLYSGPHLAGSPVIFAAAATRLGARARLLGSVGPDLLGHALAQQALALDLERPLIRPEPTACSLVASVASGSRVFHFMMAASASATPPGARAHAEAIQCVRISASSLALSAAWREFFLDMARAVRAAGGEVMLDLNLRLELMDASVHAARVAPLLALATTVTGSEEEWKVSLDCTHAGAAMAQALADGVRLAVLKKAERGVVLTGAASGPVGAFPVQVADATGAGDVWDAAFAVYRLQGLGAPAAALRANAASAIAIGTLGPTRGLPDRQQIEALVAQPPS